MECTDWYRFPHTSYRGSCLQASWEFVDRVKGEELIGLEEKIVMPCVQFLTLEGADLESLDLRTQERNPRNWVVQLFIKCRYLQVFCHYINWWQFRNFGNTFQRDSSFLQLHKLMAIQNFWEHFSESQISRHISFYYPLSHFANIVVFTDWRFVTILHCQMMDSILSNKVFFN